MTQEVRQRPFKFLLFNKGIIGFYDTSKNVKSETGVRLPSPPLLDLYFAVNGASPWIRYFFGKMIT
jgi:hypothetical protein